jgi:hypothetical protein
MLSLSYFKNHPYMGVTLKFNMRPFLFQQPSSLAISLYLIHEKVKHTNHTTFLYLENLKKVNGCSKHKHTLLEKQKTKTCTQIVKPIFSLKLHYH